MAQNAYGDPIHVLVPADSPLPEPGPGEVRVRVVATTVNTPDYWSSSTSDDVGGPLWFVSMNDGHVFTYGAGNRYFARRVRP